MVRFTVGIKITGLAVAAALLVLLVSATLTVRQSTQAVDEVVVELDVLIQENLAGIARDVYALVTTAGSLAGREEAEQSVRQAIMDITVGKTGYVYVLGGAGDQRGLYLISQGGLRDGEDIYDSVDADGREFIKAVIASALSTVDGSVVFESYRWQNEADPYPREKLVAVTYFAPWDWVIGVGAYKDDFYAARTHVESSLRTLLWRIISGGMVGAFLAIGGAVFLGRRIALPLRTLRERAILLADGDLRVDIEGTQADEVGDLSQALKRMVMQLNGIVTSVQAAVSAVSDAGTQTSASAEQVSEGANEQAASAEEVASAMEEISRVVEASVSRAHETERISLGSRDSARETADSVLKAIQAMNLIAERIVVIDGIARQTDLLALNAATEAARAGGGV